MPFIYGLKFNTKYSCCTNESGFLNTHRKQFFALSVRNEMGCFHYLYMSMIFGTFFVFN